MIILYIQCIVLFLQHSNVFWPQWKAGAHRIEKKILMPEMVRSVS